MRARWIALGLLFLLTELGCDYDRGQLQRVGSTTGGGDAGASGGTGDDTSPADAMGETENAGSVGGGTDATMPDGLGTSDIAWASDDGDANNATDERNASDASSVSDASEASDASETSDANDVSDISDASDASDVSDVMSSDVSETSDVSDVGTSDVSDVGSSDVSDVSDASDVSDVGSSDTQLPVQFEAPSLTATSSAIGIMVTLDGGGACPANPCRFVQFSTNRTPSRGDFMEFTLGNLDAGTYSVTLDHKANNNRAIVEASIDGVPQGIQCDMYSPTVVYFAHCNLGVISVATSGPHQLRLTMAGKRYNSGGYFANIEGFTFTPL